eukprot:scaffold5067_cov245-Pinguiococcus_pyrenoidosus.AAC.17
MKGNSKAMSMGLTVHPRGPRRSRRVARMLDMLSRIHKTGRASLWTHVLRGLHCRVAPRSSDVPLLPDGGTGRVTPSLMGAMNC